MKRKRLDLAELVSLANVVAVTPSWSRDKIAFFWDKTGRFELYVMDLQSRDVTQLTDGQGPSGVRAGFVWTRDDKAIVFAKDRDGDEQHNLYLLDVTSKHITQLNDDAKSQEYAVEVHPNNHSLAVNSTRSGQFNVHLLDLQTKEWNQITDFKRPASAVSFSPDGDWIAVLTNETENLKNQDGYIVKVNGSVAKKVFHTTEGAQDSIRGWHPDGSKLLVSSDVSGASRPGVLQLSTNEVTWYGPSGVDEYAGQFSCNGKWISSVRNHEASLMPVLYDVATGEERLLKLPPGMAVGGSFVLNDTKLLVQHAASNRRGELVLYDLATDTYDVLLEADYGSIDPSSFVEDEYVRYPSFDGQQVPAILYKPRDIEPGDKLPAIVNVHGGPTAQFFRGFDLYAQFLVDQGYVVLEPNVRGSTGYGVKWRDMNLQDWGGGDLEDVAAGAEYLKSLPYVDPDRIAVFGGSYGGYMSFIAVVKKPELFKVGVPVVGISDLRALHDEGMPHFQYYLRQQLGDPDENEALWLDRSALTHAEKLKAKLLIIHGINDPRCPISQARKFRDKIVSFGKIEGTEPEADFEYHEFDDEGHGPGGDVKQKMRNFNLVADFLERRL